MRVRAGMRVAFQHLPSLLVPPHLPTLVFLFPSGPPLLLQRLRQRQMRNFAVALLVAHGVPMIHMGDEYGHSKHGNNNTYCHDRWGRGECWGGP